MILTTIILVKYDKIVSKITFKLKKKSLNMFTMCHDTN